MTKWHDQDRGGLAPGRAEKFFAWACDVPVQRGAVTGGVRASARGLMLPGHRKVPFTALASVQPAWSPSAATSANRFILGWEGKRRGPTGGCAKGVLPLESRGRKSTQFPDG